MTPLNEEALAHAKGAAVDARLAGCTTEDVAECAIEAYLSTVPADTVNNVEEWRDLPIGTMARVHCAKSTEVVVRCPDGSGSGIGGMSFIGGRHWDAIYTDWNANKIEVLYRPKGQS